MSSISPFSYISAILALSCLNSNPHKHLGSGPCNAQPQSTRNVGNVESKPYGGVQSEVGSLDEGEVRERTPARSQQRSYSRAPAGQSINQRLRSWVRAARQVAGHMYCRV